MSIDAMKQALEALESVTGHFTRTPSTLRDSEVRGEAHKAITALRQAIEQAEKQEPVAWIEHHKAGDNLVWDEPHKGTPLYPSPLPRQHEQAQKQEPRQEAQIVNWNCPCGNTVTFRGFTQAPPPRQPLTDDAKRLNAIVLNSWDLRCFDMPTGQGDADIGWRVIEHHMAKPHERVVAEVFDDDPRKAIDAAIKAANSITKENT